MSKKKIFSLFIVLAMVISIIGTGGTVKAAESKSTIKINNTTLEFNNIVYVNSINGDDTLGTGSYDKPYKTIGQAGNLEKEDALFLEGTFLSSELPYDKGVSIISEGGKTVIKLDQAIDTTWNVELYGLIFKTESTSPNMNSAIRHTLGAKLHLVANNCVFWDAYNKINEAILMPDAATFIDPIIDKYEINNCLAIDNILQNFASGIDITSKSYVVNSATTQDSFGEYTVIENTNLKTVAIDKSTFNITSDGWEHTGTGKNPDGTQANIGVYGGQFAWGNIETGTNQDNKLKVVLEPNEQLQLSVNEDLSENLNVIWTSSNTAVASIDSNGVVTAEKQGNTIITVTYPDGKKEYINILIVDDAVDYRLAVDLKIGQSCRLTMDDYTFTKAVTWSVMDPTVATISNKGKVTAVHTGLTIVTATDDQGEILGQIYIRVRK